MTIAGVFLSLLERLALEAGPLPRVRALHLPRVRSEPNATPAGEFCALELEDGSLGLSYVLLGDTLARLRAQGEVETLAGADPLVVARGFGQDGLADRALGFAALNALTRCLFVRAGYEPPPSADSVGALEPAPGDHIGMVGLFRPLLARCAASGAQLTVIELRPELVGDHDGYRVTPDAEELAPCNKVLCTSTVLLNGTLEPVLRACRTARRIALVGPGAACLPDPLFARGITLLGGTWITDRRAFLEALAAGGGWGTSARKFAIRREDYPGFAALLANARGA